MFGGMVIVPGRRGSEADRNLRVITEHPYSPPSCDDDGDDDDDDDSGGNDDHNDGDYYDMLRMQIPSRNEVTRASKEASSMQTSFRGSTARLTERD
ncbi:hypothetical protein E2C01_063997 [Portunus trituberculatus]|uniref:Uncharacterized protein n=1 Tax=Portunus trituberculatus TaxID=210409 RepID=A0A5B7HIK5_PORTR|nr:hypothetical protein [Portunus trituberculatus]